MQRWNTHFSQSPSTKSSVKTYYPILADKCSGTIWIQAKKNRLAKNSTEIGPKEMCSLPWLIFNISRSCQLNKMFFSYQIPNPSFCRRWNWREKCCLNRRKQIVQITLSGNVDNPQRAFPYWNLISHNAMCILP